MITPSAKYRFGFVMTTALGNATYFAGVRKYADQIAPKLGVECVWSPVKHYRLPEPLDFLPGFIKSRIAAHEQTEAVRREWKTLDAVLFQFHEPYAWATFLRQRRGKESPLIVWTSDAPPNIEPDNYPVYTRKPTEWGRRLRLAIDRHCAARADHFFAWSPWAAECLRRGWGVEPDRITASPHGIDLEQWQEKPQPQNAVPQLLFVGGDFGRKGGEDLLRVYADRLQGRAELHLVTRPLKPHVFPLPPGVHVHTGLKHGDGKIEALYERADVFVLPTHADFYPAVLLEAAATGRPVVAGITGGVPDMVRDGETGYLVPPRDDRSLALRIEALIADPGLRQRMGEAGRRLVEREFSVETNARRMLKAMIAVTDAVREKNRRVSGSRPTTEATA